jgi:hypothetical protein
MKNPPARPTGIERLPSPSASNAASTPRQGPAVPIVVAGGTRHGLHMVVPIRLTLLGMVFLL